MTDAPAGTTVPTLPRGVRLRHDTARDMWLLMGPERLFQPDQIGVEILKRCDGKASLDAIIADLAATFGATPEQVGPDVVSFLQDLATKGMLEFA